MSLCDLAEKNNVYLIPLDEAIVFFLRFNVIFTGSKRTSIEKIKFTTQSKRSNKNNVYFSKKNDCKI